MSVNSVAQAQSRYDSAHAHLTFIENLYVPGVSDAKHLEQVQSEFNAASKALDAAKKTAQLMNSSPLSKESMGAGSAGTASRSDTNFNANPMSVAQAQAHLLVTQKQQDFNVAQVKVQQLDARRKDCKWATEIEMEFHVAEAARQVAWAQLELAKAVARDAKLPY